MNDILHKLLIFYNKIKIILDNIQKIVSCETILTIYQRNTCIIIFLNVL